jgi:hypothetical protein
MTERTGIGFAAALLLYAAVEAGGYGFAPTWIAPLFEWCAAVLVLVTSSAPAFASWRRAVRWLAPPLAIALRHSTEVDAFGTLGLIAALAASADPAISVGAERRAAAIRGVTGLLALRTALMTTVGYYAEERLARGVSTVASALEPGTLDLGPSYGGARVLLCALVVVSCVAASSFARTTAAWLALAAGAVAASVAVDLTARALPSFGSDPKAWLPGATIASQLPWLCTSIVTAAGVAVLARAKLRPIGRARSLAGVLGVSAVAVLASLPPSAPPAPRAVYCYRPGYQNWEVPAPDFATTGSYSAGMLGTLPTFCESLGLRAELGEDLSEENLARFDTLVVINQKSKLPDGALARVEAWTERGGRLIVVGDHTFFIEQPPDPPAIYVNEPLEQSGIRFPNNSADYLNHAFHEATVTYGAGRVASCVAGNPIASAIGAGLALEWPARPFVVGRHGFNDLGVEHGGGGFIGDLRWNPGERLGDVVLVAEQPRGDGWILVVGDTTGITNIGRSFAWRGWSALMTGTYHERAWQYAVVAAALLAAAGWCALRGGGAGASAALSTALAATVAVATLGGTRTIERDDAQLPSKTPIGIVDTATRPDGRAGTWHPKGQLALAINLLRAGYLAQFADSSDERVLEQASVLLLTAPRVDPGEAWAERVCAWMRAGGHLVIGCSNPDAVHIEPLFKRIGARPSPKVVGPIVAGLGEIDGRMQSIEMIEPWKLEFTEEVWRKLVFKGDDVVAATRHFGRGRITLFADSTVLTNEYLEHEKQAHLDNLHAFRIVLNGAWLRAKETEQGES